MLSTAVLFVFLLVVARPAHAEEDGMICETIELEQGVHGAGSGTSTEIVNATMCSTSMSTPLLEGCSPVDGIIMYDSRFGTDKVLPDLKKVVDSGADILCIEIILPYYNTQSWMDIPGWDEYREDFPDASKKSYADSTMAENGNRILQFLRDNNATLENYYTYSYIQPIPAAISTDLLSVLTDRDDVVNVDVYGKNVHIPEYIEMGWESKIDPLIHKEIKHGKQNCTFEKNFDTCPLLARNPDGTPVVRVVIGIETRVEPPGESLADFLIRNNQDVTHDRLLSVSANVATDFLTELHARNDVRMISSGNDLQIRSGGSIKQDNARMISDGHNSATSVLPDVKDLSAQSTATGLDVPYRVQLEYDVQIGSPLQQIKDGIAASDVQCRDDLILTIMLGGRPACVTKPTIMALAERGLVQ